MKTTLLDLWNGNISPWSEQEHPIEEIRTLVGLIEKNSQNLSLLLDDHGATVLEKLEAYYDELMMLEREDAFVRGFSLGVKLVTEALGHE